MSDACIYLRVSTLEQDPENQLEDCENYIDSQGWDLVKVYSDKSSAWKKGNVRKEFEQMLSDAREGKFKHIIVWDYDRFYRNRKRFVETIKGYAKIGVQVHSVNQKYFDDLYTLPVPFNDMMIDFLIQWEGYRSEEESNRKSRRVKIAYKNRRGKWGRPQVSNYKKRKVRSLRAEGYSITQITNEVKLSRGCVHKIITKKVS